MELCGVSTVEGAVGALVWATDFAHRKDVQGCGVECPENRILIHLWYVERKTKYMLATKKNEKNTRSEKIHPNLSNTHGHVKKKEKEQAFKINPKCV